MCVGLYETSHHNLFFVSISVCTRFTVRSSSLAVSVKLRLPFDKIPPAFASYDCETVHTAFLRRNFIKTLSPVAEDMLLIAFCIRKEIYVREREGFIAS